MYRHVEPFLFSIFTSSLLTVKHFKKNVCLFYEQILSIAMAAIADETENRA